MTDASDYLRERGGPDVDGAGGGDGLAVRRARVAEATVEDLVAGGWTVPEAADLLGMSMAGVAGLIRDGGLYVYVVDGAERVARWQSGAEGLLPGLPVVVAAIPDNMHPLAVAGFMTRPNTDFDGLAPAEWLADGRDPDAVAAWLEGLGRA